MITAPVPTLIRTQSSRVGGLPKRVTIALLLLLAPPLSSSAADAPNEETSPATEDLLPLRPLRPKKPQPPSTDWAQWNDVVRFRGHSECRRLEETLLEKRSEVTTGYQIDVSTGTFVLEHVVGTRWDAVSGKIVGSHHAVNTTDYSTHHGRSGSDAMISGASKHFGLTLDTKRGTWSFYAYGKLLQSYDYTFWTSSRDLVGAFWKEENDTGTMQKSESAHFSTKDEPLPAGLPGPLRGVWDINTGTLQTGKSTYHGTVLLVPEYKGLELVVEIEGVDAAGKSVPYEKWIPRGTVRGAAGSHLKIKARLQGEDDSPVKAKVDVFSFELVDTSREPGVCLNYPRVPAAASGIEPPPDLKFLPTGGTDADRQKLEVTPQMDDPGHPHAEAQVDCYDYGAWSELWVYAELADGRSITGHLKDDPTAIMMPLPKRTGASRIADAWKEQHGLTAVGDNDDSEKLPSAGKVAGDGFTLYEEYRGFVENGKHIEGDPKKIDFFVRNYIGGDARPGIDLFARLTGAEVHERLRDAEFDPEKRVMNANHDRGPHRVDQHGVYLRTKAGLDGAEARFSTASVRGRPRLCQEIAVQPREAQTPTMTSENLPASELVFAYDRAIAHELLHAVGVEHHGNRDYASGFQFVFADDLRNKTGKPIFWSGFSVSEHVVTITDERTGRDLAEILAPDLMLAREKDRARFFDDFKARTIASWGIHPGSDVTQEQVDQAVDKLYNEVFGHFYWHVGAEHGECSGDEDCVTRYYFAQLFEKQGVPRGSAFYFISDKKTERAGLNLCRSRVGTGVNAPGRKPQPRYGDTNPGWGECADWIVFNDAAPDERAPTP